VNATVSSPATHRTVLVLGRRPTGSGWPSADDLAGSRALVVITIGWPVTDAQRERLDHAEALARAAKVVLDAFLVPSSREAAVRTELGDELTIDAGPREGRRIRRALDQQLISARDAR
jgi:hypothetical protein